jgi:hypothetical protein
MMGAMATQMGAGMQGYMNNIYNVPAGTSPYN